MIRSALVLLLLLTGCAAGPTTNPTPAATPSKGDPVPVTVLKTGGFAGLKETITVDETGKWDKGSSSGRLTMEQSEKLQTLATNPNLAKEAAEVRAQTKCADAFNYTVTVGQVSVQYVDCPSDGPPPAVASQIVALVNAAAV